MRTHFHKESLNESDFVKDVTLLRVDITGKTKSGLFTTTTKESYQTLLHIGDYEMPAKYL